MIIKTKIIAIIALTILLTVGTTTAVLLKIQNGKLIESKFQDTAYLSDIIERTIENSMREGNTVDVQRIIENIAKNKEILNLRILSPDGVILKSNTEREIGSRSADFVKNHVSPGQKPTLINETTINYFHGIRNRQECYQCHDSSRKIIGFVQIKYDISRNFASFLSLQRLTVISNVAIVILISFMISLLFSRLIMNPLDHLLSAIKKVETGDWRAAVKVTGRDELGVIAAAFNKMIREINGLHSKTIAKERELSEIRVALEHKTKVEILNSQLEHKIRELDAANNAITSLSREVKDKNVDLEKAVERLKKINDIGRMLSSIVEIQELMRIIIQTTADLFRFEKVTLYLKKPQDAPVTIQYSQGGGFETLQDLSADLKSEFKGLFLEGRPVIISESSSPDHPDHSLIGHKVAVSLKLKGLAVGAIILENSGKATIITEEEIGLLTTISNQAMVAIENAGLYESVKANYFATIQSLVNALEASDRFTKGHSERVRMLSVELGKYIGLDYREIELLEHAAILHDIGKIGIDNFILQKQGKLTSKEYSLIKTHPLIGDDILGPINTLEAVRKTIIQHHERYDGKGYPYGLKGDEISLKSKILSVVDTFDAMMTDRPYRKALTLHEIKEELKTNAGTQFDAYVVESFVEMLNIEGNRLLGPYVGYNTTFSSG